MSKLKFFNDNYDQTTFPTPKYAHVGDSGMDICINTAVGIAPNEVAVVSTGIYVVDMPENTELQLRPRSSTARKYKVTIILGTIDNTYRGELLIQVYNLSATNWVKLPEGAKIAQLVLAPVISAEIEEVSLEEYQESVIGSSRGIGGFGSTDKA